MTGTRCGTPRLAKPGTLNGWTARDHGFTSGELAYLLTIRRTRQVEKAAGAYRVIQLLAQVFRRYVLEHLHLRKPGFAILDERGNRIGHVEWVAVVGNRLRVEGWCDADRLALVAPGSRVMVVPVMNRPDVQAARGGNANLGFVLDAPYTAQQTLLSVETGSLRYMQPLVIFDRTDLRRGAWRLLWPFLRDMIGVIPQAVVWVMRRDPGAKARIKAALGFGDRRPVGLMNVDLFRDPDKPAAVPVGLQDTRITIVLPVYNAFDLLAEVLDRIERHTDLPWRIVVIEDRSSDDRVRPFLRDWAAGMEDRLPGQVFLIENEQNLGFIQSVNTALKTASQFGDHVVLLNSDAFVPKNWASRLVRPILAHDNVASVTPMSNDAEIFSVPVICTRTLLATGDADLIDAMAQTFEPDAELAVTPTGVGFCMAINKRYLAMVPQLDTGFGRGYGEEVDWCQKVRLKGGRHLGLSGLFVEHRGGTSFGSAEKLKLVLANNAVISRRYPSYDAEVQEFIRHDPLATPRLALAIAWAAHRQPKDLPVPVYLAHSMGGGADEYLKNRIAADIRDGGSAVVLRVGNGSRWQIELHCLSGKVRGVTQDAGLMARLLAPIVPRRVVYSCGVGDSDPVSLPDHLLALAAAPGSTLEVLFHDYFPVSPSYTLLNDQGVYTGLPDVNGTDTVHRNRRPDGRSVPLGEWQTAWGRLITAADEVVCFSRDSAEKVAAVWPAAARAIVVRPHGMLHAVPRVTPPQGHPRPVIGVLGNIGHQKGVAVLAEMSRLLARSREADLVVVGNIDPAFPLTPPAVVHGNYQLRDIPDLVARYGISCWLIPSIWPETFSYATHEVLATGLPVWCFDLGAQAEAVRTATSCGAPGGVIALHQGRAPTETVADIILSAKEDA